MNASSFTSTPPRLSFNQVLYLPPGWAGEKCSKETGSCTNKIIKGHLAERFGTLDYYLRSRESSSLLAVVDSAIDKWRRQACYFCHCCSSVSGSGKRKVQGRDNLAAHKQVEEYGNNCKVFRENVKRGWYWFVCKSNAVLILEGIFTYWCFICVNCCSIL